MTGVNLADKIRKATKQNSASLTDADILLLVNPAKDELAELIAQHNEQMFVMTSLASLVASTIAAREYSFPDDVLNSLVTVEVALDPNQPTNYVPVIPYPGGLQRALRETDGLTESKIASRFTNYHPYYVIMRRSIVILSGTIQALSDGLKLRSKQYPADLASLAGTSDLSIDPTTTTFGMPRQSHRLWVDRCSIEWKGQHPNSVQLTKRELDYDKNLLEMLKAIRMDDFGAEVFGSLPSEDSSGQLGQDL